MATVSRNLPDQPDLEVPKREARELLEDWRARQPAAFDRIRQRHPRFKDASNQAIASGEFLLNDAQLVVAREYGFENWTDLKLRIKANTPAQLLIDAIHNGDCAACVSLLSANPELLHIPLWSGNWGPPMSTAANLDRLEIIKAIAALGARDFQHAFDRAILQGKLESARWLHAHGAVLAPGLVMGPCETQNAAGLAFLIELGAPLTDAKGDRLAPLALVLETYCRNPKGKAAILEIFAKHGYELPNSPMMALHRGDLARLEQFIQHDPHLLARRFTSLEIYPPELGCSKDGKSGMHWTAIDGGTLLHIAIDFDAMEVFDLLLQLGADVNATATIDSDGFGGHTPLFNAIVSHGQHQGAMAAKLVERGASKTIRANLRKFLDWCETPRWHIANNVTPAEWAQTFPDQSWVNKEALRLVA